jgi:hypothetical protein
MSNATHMVEAMKADGQYLMSRGRRDATRVSREHAWSDVKVWMKDSNVKWIRVSYDDKVWVWNRTATGTDSGTFNA